MIKILLNFFKKKEETCMLFGRELRGKEIYAPKTCDVCGKEVSFSDCAYLCSRCYESLPHYVHETHHWLIPYREARKEYLTKAITSAKGVDESAVIITMKKIQLAKEWLQKGSESVLAMDLAKCAMEQYEEAIKGE